MITVHSQQGGEMPGRQTQAMTWAIEAITHKHKKHRLTVAEAAAKFGVKVNSIYRRPDYKAWRAQQEATNA
jgi:hypothetical protein